MTATTAPEPTEEPTPAPTRANGGGGPITARFLAMPIWLRLLAYTSSGMAVLATTRVLTGANQLTAAGTWRSAVELSIPIALAGLGGLWSERAGVVNIGLEGMMVLGTWFGAYGGIAYGPWQGVLLGVAGGALGGLLHAIATVVFGVDHIISGVAINLLAVGLTQFLTSVSWGGTSTRESPTIPDNVAEVDLFPFLKQPLERLASENRFWISDMADFFLALTTNLSLLIIVAALLFPLTYYILWKTPFGLRVRSAGEDPDAADSLGVNVYRVKFIAVTVSGMMAGLGGVSLVYLFSGKFQSGQTNGRGFIGLAAMIFGNWRPGGLVAGAGLFGFMDSMQSQVDETAHALLITAAIILAGMAIWMAVRRRWVAAAVDAALAAGFWWWYASTDELPSELIPYFPHITTLLVLAFASQRLRMPAADGRVWRRGGH